MLSAKVAKKVELPKSYRIVLQPLDNQRVNLENKNNVPMFAAETQDKSMNKNEKKILELGLYVALPINLQLLLTQSERDVLNTLRHLDNIGTSCASLSLLRLYTGLSGKTIQCALRNLETLGVISKGAVCKAGTHYQVLYKRLGSALMQLNQEKSPVGRLRLADKFRGSLANNASLIKEFENTEFDY